MEGRGGGEAMDDAPGGEPSAPFCVSRREELTASAWEAEMRGDKERSTGSRASRNVMAIRTRGLRERRELRQLTDCQRSSMFSRDSIPAKQL